MVKLTILSNGNGKINGNGKNDGESNYNGVVIVICVKYIDMGDKALF